MYIDILKIVENHRKKGVVKVAYIRYFLYLCSVKENDMVQQQQTLNLSPYSQLYDLLVKKDSDLRRIHDEIDLSFVYTELIRNYCEDNGRTAIDPIRMFRYLLLKVIYDLSDVAVVERSLTDLSFKYFLDMAPEDTEMIDPSSLAKFRKFRLKSVDLLTLLIGRTISIAKEKKLIKRGTVIVDATHSSARAIVYKPADYLLMRISRLSKSLETLCHDLVASFPKVSKGATVEELLEVSRDIVGSVRRDKTAMNIPAAKNCLELLEEAIDEAETRGFCSRDKDAHGGYKSANKSFFGTKEHLAIESETGLVTAAVVTSGEKVDGAYVKELVEQSRENGIDVDEVIGDKAYSSTENLELADQEVMDGNGNPVLNEDGSVKRNFTLYSQIHKNISNVLNPKNDGFTFNKDADTMACPAGHLAIHKMYNQRKSEKHNNPCYEYHFNVEKCKQCPLRDGCYKPGAKTKTYRQTILPKLHKDHIEFEKTNAFRDKMRERYKIEAKNADLKHNYGLDRATSYGLENMTMQTALSIFACNIKRILRLTAGKTSK